MNRQQCSETPAYKIQTPGNYPRRKNTTNYNVLNVTKWRDHGPNLVEKHVALYSDVRSTKNSSADGSKVLLYFTLQLKSISLPSGAKGKGKGHPCTGTEALYRPYGP
jgi:hypothetical protein